MNKTVNRIAACVVVVSVSVAANATVIGDMNWADEVAAYSSNIQNYGGTLMSTATESWLTGSPDADANGNGYAWDTGDSDSVAGWRSNAPGEYITMSWAEGIPDRAGDDLTIRYYSGPSSLANVLASVDGTSFTQIGTIGNGTPGYLADATFDFSGLFVGDVNYIRVERVASGPNTGMFFDAFGGVAPEPATLVLLGCGAAAFRRRRIRQ